MLLALMLSILPMLQALTVDYAGFNTSRMCSTQVGALSNSFAQGLNKLRHLSVRNLEGTHEIQSLNLVQHLVALPSMRKLQAVTYLPLLPAAFETTALTSLKVEASDRVKTIESFKLKSFKLTELLKVSPAINKITLTVPFDQRLIGSGDYSTILNPIAKTLETLVVDYDIKGNPQHWDRGFKGWPQFLSLAKFSLLTHLDISWHFFFDRIKASDTSQPEHAFMIEHLPSALESLTIHNIAITIPDLNTQNSGFPQVPNNRLSGHFIPAQLGFLRHLQKLGIAHRTGVMARLKEVKLEVLLAKRMLPEVLLSSHADHSI